jgi:hypothetical protein
LLDIVVDIEANCYGEGEDFEVDDVIADIDKAVSDYRYEPERPIQY